jgi:hypothetical protein
MTTKEVQADSENQIVDQTILHEGLKTVRRRRWYLWMIILVYMPLMMTAMEFFSSVATVFIIWFIIMVAIVTFSALARCPRCGNYFHMHGLTLLYLRKCLHCQLHVCADKRR